MNGHGVNDKTPFGSQRQPLQQGPAVDGYPLIVEDLGTNTNDRRYEKDHGFTSAVVARAGGVATPLWAVGLAAVYPAAGRTDDTITTIYTLVIENATGAAVTAWLEIGGVVVTPDYHVNDDETAVISFVAGLTVGNQDIECNASANAVEFQIMGTQE